VFEFRSNGFHPPLLGITLAEVTGELGERPKQDGAGLRGERAFRYPASHFRVVTREDRAVEFALVPPPGKGTEVPLARAVDQKALVAILRKRAAADGHLHVGNVSRRRRDFQARSGTSSPDQRGALFVGVWRGADDRFPEADAGDDGHPGRAWITFSRGEDPVRSALF
jgi:hypothetical protein